MANRGRRRPSERDVARRFGLASTLQVPLSIVSGLLVALIVVGVECVLDSSEKHSQQEETREFIAVIENSVFNPAREDEIIAVTTEARNRTGDFPVPLREQLRLERFLVALDSLEFFLTVRTPLLPSQDRFEMLRLVIEARNIANLFDDSKQYGAVSDVARDFFSLLRSAVAWLGT